jgi:putative restriction endonuclease
LAWSDVAGRLADLIAEFGPPSRTSRLQRAAYPFTHLRSDGVWRLSADVPMDLVRPLEAARATGRLSSAIEDELRGDLAAIEALARRVVDMQWPSTVAPDVLVAVGFDPEAGESAEHGRVIGARRRSAAWRHGVLAAWDGACAFCGFDGSLSGVPVGVEAAHVRWFTIGGPDELDNGLALCALHHKLFDRGALGLTTDHRVEVSGTYRAVGPGRAVYELHGVRLAPRPGTALPAEGHIRWHHAQVFLGQPLTA